MAPDWWTGRRRSGFTLIEVLAALVIVALLSGLAATVVVRSRPRATLDTLIEQVAAYEGATRDFAKRHGEPLRLVFTETTLEQAFVDEETDALSRPPLHLPDGYEMQVLRPEGLDDEAVEVSVEGRSRTYVLRLRSAEREDRWVVFAGITGDPRVIEHEPEVDSILAMLSEPRLPELDAFETASPDAD